MSWRVRILAIVVVSGLASVGIWLHVRQSPELGNDAIGGLAGNAAVGGPFTLTDQDGKPFGLDDLAGRYALIYFGYTYCPDVCPTELGKVAAAIDLLGDAGNDVTPVLITIDPERDTAAVLHDYVPLFHERLVGLTGTPDEIRKVAKEYRVFYRKVDAKEYGGYLMDHSSFVYLVAPDGHVAAMFPFTSTSEDIAKAIRKLKAR